jgi:hypothetical protein
VINNQVDDENFPLLNHILKFLYNYFIMYNIKYYFLMQSNNLGSTKFFFRGAAALPNLHYIRPYFSVTFNTFTVYVKGENKVF